MRTVLLPVKDFVHAKQRLASELEPTVRAGLARAMLSDVLSAVMAASRPERVVVFTASSHARKIATFFGAEVVVETEILGHSAAVNRMVRELSVNSSQILSISSDLPVLTAYEVDLLLDSHTADVSLVSSRDGKGTNAAVFSVPARIRMQYGEDSLARHLSSAAAAGLSVTVLRVPGIEFDVDTPADLKDYIARGPYGSSTWKFVCNSGLTKMVT